MDAAAKKPQLDPLTSIRFFAAFHVVVYHSAVFLTPALPEAAAPLHHLVRTGYTGVNLFYILSGYILAYTYLDPDRPVAVGGQRFWIARFARVYPIYALSLLMVAPLVAYHFASTNPPVTAVAKFAVSGGVAASLLQAWIPPLRAVWNPPAWSLSAEAFFYLSFPLLAAWIWRLSPRGAFACALACWGVGLLPGLAAFVLTPEAAAVSAVDHFGPGALATFLRGAPILRLPEFAFGVALARAFFPTPSARARWGGGGAEIVAWLALAGLAAALVYADRIPRMLVHAGILNPLYGAMIAALALSGGPLARMLSLRPLIVLGQVSYAIYLFHIPVKHWIFVAFPAGRAVEMGVTFFAGYVALVVGVAIGVFYLVEDPARHWIRRRFGGPRAPATASPRAQSPSGGPA